MKAKEKLQQVKEVFAGNTRLEEVYQTADGNCFVTAHDARVHERHLGEAFKGITPWTREAVQAGEAAMSSEDAKAAVAAKEAAEKAAAKATAGEGANEATTFGKSAQEIADEQAAKEKAEQEKAAQEKAAQEKAVAKKAAPKKAAAKNGNKAKK